MLSGRPSPPVSSSSSPWPWTRRRAAAGAESGGMGHMAESTAGMPVLQARNISKRFGSVTALERVDFELYPDEILALVGDNGAGKSTLIKILSGAYQPDEGEILIDGEPVHIRNPQDARRLGIETVYQDLALAPALDI